jgi:hypothetical protein
MAEGTDIRAAQRKVSHKIVQLLGRDPTTTGVFTKYMDACGPL